ncbi:hypothetical protein AO398_08610 [Methylobacterium sp. GXS13]|jgi:hypothetical protein|uniref:hypothetical protein n=1 Tax=Methylobacterium sp. GXS13 TaxID=1730094 RepID=UPI00071BD26A|nr:hypothetical protein [Methylobacterium sp. GXS13]KST57041.1 hypothetical protein AO398_08610 [Methylobacterium sp. GXS13]
MRPLVLAWLCIHLVAGAIGAGALAQQSRTPRPAGTTRMTCAEAMALIKNEGDVVIAGGTNSERFVSGPDQCNGSEIAELRFVPTRDNPQCPIGYRCREPGFEEWNW